MSILENKGSIYSRKALYKRVLIVAALIIVGVSFFYSSQIVKKLSEEERTKVKLWADAIESKANTVNRTATLFIDLGKIEEKKVRLWARAIEAFTRSNSLEPANNDQFKILAVEIIEDNQSIPIIMTNEQGVITESRNIDMIDTTVLSGDERHEAYWRNKEILDSNLQVMISKGNRIDVNYYGDSYLYLYYNESRVLGELRSTFDKIQKNFVEELIRMASSTPVIYMRADTVVASNKVDSIILADSILLDKELKSMGAENDVIEVNLGYGALSYIYFSDSYMLKQLKYFSVIQTVVIMLFVLIGYWLFSIFRRSEQNNVWVGMAKETAHQLGTPLSSLMGWMEMLRMKNVDKSITDEMQKDVDRLNMITDRFSKIGAKPNLEETNVYDSLQRFVGYFKTRAPRKVKMELIEENAKDLITPLNEPLFHWVIENLCKNGIDAMEGKGEITIHLFVENGKTVVEVTDTGKGIDSGNRNAVFQPGFTSKQRGWGLGLSLSKRIVKEYHSGKIFVKWSEVGKGTTFRIELNQ